MVGGCLGLVGSSRRVISGLSDHISIGVLTRVFPPELVDRVVAEAGRGEQRQRLLPARVVVYYVLALALFADASYEEVMRQLVEGLAWESGWRAGVGGAEQGGDLQGAATAGSEPLELLFGAVAAPLASEATRGAFYRGLRLVSLDGTCLDVADTPANEEAFGRPGSSRREGGGAFPQLRLVALAESGTHAIIDAALGPYTSSEQELADRLLGLAEPGMLCLADRGFYSFERFQNGPPDRGAAALAGQVERGAAARADAPRRLVPDQHLPARADRRASRDGEPGPGRSSTGSTTPRLRRQRAALPAAHHDPRPRRRRPPPSSPRSTASAGRSKAPSTSSRATSAARASCCAPKHPDGVYQEAYGYLCTHYAIRRLMHDAALQADLDPDRLIVHPRPPRRPPQHPHPAGIFPPTASTPPTSRRSLRSSPSRSPNAASAPTPASSNARCPTGPSNAPTTATGPSPPSHQTTQSPSSPPKLPVLWGQDSNLRRQCQTVYSPSPLTTRTPHGTSSAVGRERSGV